MAPRLRTFRYVACSPPGPETGWSHERQRYALNHRSMRELHMHMLAARLRSRLASSAQCVCRDTSLVARFP